jgi:alkylated DNA repair dioxygenase AlkB
VKTKQSDLFSQTRQVFDLPDAKVEYFSGMFEERHATRLFDALIKKVEWVQNTIRFYGKESPVPRLEAWYGDEGKSYAYSGIRMNPKPWIEELLEIKKAIEPIAGTQFNSVLINYYRDGQDRVAWHSDDEKELGHNPVIGSVSLGAERKFKLRHKSFDKNGKQAEIMLAHGSLLLMKGPTQRFWKHEIPRTARPVGQRINLTFRVIKPTEGQK